MRRPSRRWLAAATAAAALVASGTAAGCGGGDDGAPADNTAPAAADPQLKKSELASLQRAEQVIVRYCAAWSGLTQGGGPRPGQAEQARGAVDQIVDLVELKPRAPIGETSDVRLRAGDIAEGIEGANCDPALEARLESGIAAAVGG